MWFLWSTLLLGSFSLALPYFHHTRNEDLHSQLEERSLPQLEKFSFAADVYLFKPWNLEGRYYHGNGYWLNTFIEARPRENLSLNLKLAAYNGASSYGYGHADRLEPRFGLTWAPSAPGWKFYVRYFDLDRQTTGAGLLLQDKEMNGLILSLARGAWRYKGLIDGTGGFTADGDFYYQQIDYGNNLVGLSVSFVNFGKQNCLIRSTEKGIEARPVMGYGPLTWSLFTQAPVSQAWALLGEAGLRNRAFGALAGIRYEPKIRGAWQMLWHLEGRAYAKGFGEQISGWVNQDYVSAEVLDKSYFDGPHLLQEGDNLSAGAMRLDLEYRIPDQVVLASSSEGIITSRGRSTYLFRNSLALCPYPDMRRSCVQAFF